MTTPTKLTIDDIADLRAYERERDEFRARIIELKKRRRVSVGPFITLVFENRDTVRFQIQEMARAEKIITDEGVQHELDTYNPLIPEPGVLSARLFIELTGEVDLQTWLPKLVGIEAAVELRFDGSVLDNVVDEDHADQLTRDTTTASVHYVRFELTPAQVEVFGAEPVRLAVAHPSYEFETVLAAEAVAELRRDLTGA
ncbi:MAG: DUF3501 family protein [Acidimicrobiales bacterium]